MSSMMKICTIDYDQGQTSVFAKNVGLNRAAAHCKSINEELLNINTAETIAILDKGLEDNASQCVLYDGNPMSLYFFHSGLETYYGVGTWQDGQIYNASDPIQTKLFAFSPPSKNDECTLIGYFPAAGGLFRYGCTEKLPFICVGEGPSVVIEPSTCSFDTKYGKLNAFSTYVSLDDAENHCKSENQELFVMNQPDVFDVLPSHLSKCAGHDNRHATMDDYLFHAGLQFHNGDGFWRDGLRLNGSDPRQRDLFIIPPRKSDDCMVTRYMSLLGKLMNFDCRNGKSAFICVESNEEVNSTAMNNESQVSSLSALHVDMNYVQNVEDGYSWQHIFFIMMVASFVIFIVGFIARSWLRKQKAKKENIEEHSNGSTQSGTRKVIYDTVYNKDARF